MRYLVLFAVVYLGWRLVEIVVWPFEACPRCKGAGKFTSPRGRRWRSCRRCAGSGKRVRRGRRTYDYVRSRRYR